MKRETLEQLGLTADQIDAVMKENGNDINREKSRYADYDEIRKQLDAANEAINKMADYDAVKADVAKYQQEAEAAKKEAAEKVARLELQAKIKDFTNTKKFVNDLTRDAINSQLESALNDEANKGRSLEDILGELTKDKTDIFKVENAPQPPIVPGMAGSADKESGVMAAFKAMNPNIKL